MTRLAVELIVQWGFGRGKNLVGKLRPLVAERRQGQDPGKT